MGKVLRRHGATLLLLLQSCAASEANRTGQQCLSPSVVTTVLEDPFVGVFLHQEMPERDPLKVAGPGLAGGVPIYSETLHLVGASVEDAARADVFRFTRCMSVGAAVAVVFHLQAEGMLGSATLRRTPGGGAWKIETRDVHER